MARQPRRGASHWLAVVSCHVRWRGPIPAEFANAAARHRVYLRSGSKHAAPWRDGKEVELKLKTAELSADASSGASGGRADGDREGKLGLALQTLTPELAERLDVARSLKGAVITAVRPQSPAGRAGLRSGDVIVEVDHTDVADADDAARRLAVARDGGHLVRVQRGDVSVFVVLSPTGGTP